MTACAACATPCRPRFRVPPAELSPDLDGRPGEPARSTLPRWVQLCPGCGAAAPDLAALSPDEVARSRGLGGDRFLRWSAITADPAEAAEAILQAAWLREDAGHDAAALRRRAADAWHGDPLRRVDILRRAGALAEAAALLDGLGTLDEDGARIVAFQRARIAAGDTGRHLLSSALRPPARTPHVSHVQKPASRPGLLSRLFGR